MTILKYSVTFVCISLRFVYNNARESELRKKVRTVTRAINMIHKYHAFKTLVIKTLGITWKSNSLPETEKYEIINKND